MPSQKNTCKWWLSNYTASFREKKEKKKTVLEIQQRSFTQSEPICTESLTSLASRNVTCLQTHLSSRNTACKSVGQAISISRLLWENLFGIYSNIVPERLSRRAGSLSARFFIHTKKKRSSIQKAYNLNIRQGSKCVQTTRQASGSGEAISPRQAWGCPKYAVRMAQPKKHCP